MFKHAKEANVISFSALDFSKAFDKVPHAHLYQKLSHYGVAMWAHIVMVSGFSN